MKKRNILYLAIGIVCIIAIIVAVYAQIFEDKVVTGKENKVITFDNAIEEDPVDNPKDILAEFNSLFNNELDTQDNSIGNIKKLEGFEDKDIVFTYEFKEEKEEQYDIDVKLPTINIEKASSLNEKTRTMFVNKIDEILQGTNKYNIYNLDYVAYVNDNILSIAIRATRKEGNSAQRLIVQTYNYDLINNKEVTLNEVLESQEYSKRTVNKKIEEQVKEASKQAETISQATGQIVYKRNIEDSMYTTDKANNFLIGKDGQIYIVFSYGIENQTTEIDIIKL